MGPSPQEELELLKRLSRGDKDAFTTIYHQQVDRLFATVIKYVPDKDEAQEIVQQIFIKFWDRRETLGAVRNLKDYFFVATRNMVFNHFNRLSREARLLHKVMNHPEPATEETDSRLREKEYQQLLNKAIALLPPQQQQVYRLAEQQHLGYDEIAQRLQLARPTVKKHMELARKFIRQYISTREGASLFLLLFTLHCYIR